LFRDVRRMHLKGDARLLQQLEPSGRS
jgi:hypothetical protein